MEIVDFITNQAGSRELFWTIRPEGDVVRVDDTLVVEAKALGLAEGAHACVVLSNGWHEGVAGEQMVGAGRQVRRQSP